MKHKTVLCLALFTLLLLAACQPTPENDIIVNKGDSSVENKLRATTAPADGSEAPTKAIRFPNEWVENHVSEDGLTKLNFSLEVTQKSDGVYPVYRTRSVSVDSEYASAILSKSFGNPVAVREEGLTKADWTQRLHAFLEGVAEQQAWVDAGKPDWGDRDETVLTQEQIDEQVDYYRERINEAPEDFPKSAVSDFSSSATKVQSVYTLEDDTPLFVSLRDTSLIAGRNCTGVPYSYTRYYYEFDISYEEVRQWVDPTVEKERALEMGQEFLQQCGFTGYALYECVESNLYNDAQRQGVDTVPPVTAGWELSYRQDFGGYPLLPLVLASQHMNYGMDESYLANAYIYQEEVTLFVDENGVQYLCIANLKEIIGIENTAVELLPFEAIQQRARQGFGYGVRGKNIDVYRAVLTVQTLRVKDSTDYYEMPCWVFFFEPYGSTRRSNKSPVLPYEMLLINAVDGSIIHTDYGY